MDSGQTGLYMELFPPPHPQLVEFATELRQPFVSDSKLNLHLELCEENKNSQFLGRKVHLLASKNKQTVLSLTGFFFNIWEEKEFKMLRLSHIGSWVCTVQ
uniref:Uncharacterized protein n=1 Tax=Micrurus lemniscatus lemniscatus TaxID=129467 RepID=A0A2D4ID23_MICLE